MRREKAGKCVGGNIVSQHHNYMALERILTKGVLIISLFQRGGCF